MQKYTGIGEWITGFEGIASRDGPEESVHSDQEIAEWLRKRKEQCLVQIRKIDLEACTPWYYDHAEGSIRNRDGSFFRIVGMEAAYPDGTCVSQPMILQPEIGYLGIACKRFNGVWHFLMQAKIEPGNINYVQISPTLQATRSNFTRRHGGKEPPYLRLFKEMRQENILVDQIHSEQSSRFWGKRNRNVFIRVEEEVEELPSHRWMTLRQISRCMAQNNLVNMDTRTVFSCMPYVFMMNGISGYSPEFTRSMREIRHEDMTNIFLRINDYKMFGAPILRKVPLLSLKEWGFEDRRFCYQAGVWPYEVIFCDINIEGREVTQWNQPLVAALGKAVFGLICRRRAGRWEVLVCVKPEPGCFDSVELGPSIQEEYGISRSRDAVAEAFFSAIQDPKNVRKDVILSEEGGRFFHEQNRNVIVEVDADFSYDPDRYIWTTLGSLNALTQINNCLNIQLRNLLMLFFNLEG